MKKQKGHIFISHSTHDDLFVKNLRQNLQFQGLEVWVDSQKLRGGDKLEPQIKKAIEEAQAFILVFSLNTINSAWVRHEVNHALKVQKKKEKYPVIPLMLEGVKPAALKSFFKKEPVDIKVNTGPGGIAEAMAQILAALEERDPDDIQPMLAPETRPMDELLLELTEPRIIEQDGVRRAAARARLKYVPAGKGNREVEGTFIFTAPLGPIEKEELSWYLERYYFWPTGLFKEQAKKVEALLPKWGGLLYQTVFDHPTVREVLAAWEKPNHKAERRFTVFVDEQWIAEADDETEEKTKKIKEAKEAATLLLTLPWELLHHGKGYLFQGAKPVQVRRRLPHRQRLDTMTVEPPIRILLVSPRPEDEAAGYIDHRISALPLVEALESLGDLVQMKVLSPPTFPAFEQELTDALEAGTPYHVVHFDGHGVFSKKMGLGGLCFEDPQDSKKLEKRRSKIIYTEELAAVLHQHRIPLVFLEACQSAQSKDDPTASVAAALLDRGVASVVAMSHSVLIETAKRFVTSFYRELVKGSRVGKAMLAGQRTLKAETFRLKIFGAGRLDMQDWFVPVLYQEKEDLQLLTRVPSKQIQETGKKAWQTRLGDLPKEPDHQFVGRSRELLTLERLLGQVSYAVICGQGGEGKTTLAAELARWLVRTRRFDRAAFISVEDVYDVRTVVDRLGRQMFGNYSVAQYNAEDLLDKAMHPIEQQLRQYRTLIVLDNMESILPSGGGGETDRFEPEELERFFLLCQKLLDIAGTALLFTSREPLPQPFHVAAHKVTLSRLHQEDAIQLVHQAMRAAGLEPKEDDTRLAQPEVEALVESVNCHARSLVLLAPYIGEFGVRSTTENLGRLMAQLHKKYPNERERSLFASLELSLRRMPQEMRQKIKPLGMFQGGGHIVNIGKVLELEEEERDLLVGQLLQLGLAEAMPYGFVRFHPALCPYLLKELEENEDRHAAATERWAESMKQLSDFLYQQRYEDTQLSATLTTMELPNLVRLLEHVRAQGDAETTVGLAAKLEQLLRHLGRKQLLARVAGIREKEAEALPGWTHTRFAAFHLQIQGLLGRSNFPWALQEARAILDKCVHAGDEAYPEAPYDTAMAYMLLGEVLNLGGAARDALPPTQEAQKRFQALAYQGDKDAAGMASAALGQKGDCLRNLGRLQEAAQAYEQGIELAEKSKRLRDAAVGKCQLGTVRLLQNRFNDALNAYEQALKIFSGLGEPLSVATIWHLMGNLNEEAGQFEKAEQAYRQSLSINVQQHNPAGEAITLNQLGILYNKMNRLEDAVIFHRQAADKYVEINDMAKEGAARGNIANTLIKLGRYENAREEIHRAIQCIEPYSHATEPWKAWNILSDLETAVGNQSASAKARRQAMDLFLAYRRDGGENHEPGGRFCAMVEQAINAGQTEEIEKLLAEVANAHETHPKNKLLISKLQALLSGSRDPALWEDPGLFYMDAIELMMLLEKIKR
jgi:tetratricopeptide (TPR) repeat protein